VILSRKGFDAKYGGFASPILPDGRLISLPVPALHGEDNRIQYGDLWFGKNQRIIDLLQEIGRKKIKIPRNKRARAGKNKWKYVRDQPAHVDPDLRKGTLKRKSGWKGLFGQSDGSQTHLENNGVSRGDLFLFFGWFKKYKYDETGRLVIDNKDRKDYSCGKHVIFGYLQIGDILRLDRKEARVKVEEWMKYHSHIGENSKFVGSDEFFGKNALYIAKDALTFASRLKGFGTFIYNNRSARDLTLTKKGYSRSKWDLPRPIFKEARISYHPNPWKKDYFQSANVGQEFVIEDNSRIKDWAISLIRRFAEI